LARIDDLVLKNALIANYEGEVKDRKPHGIGCAYYRSGGRYEGHWEEGNRSGYGREFYPDGALRYEGNWENGLRSGYGKSYYTTGELAYEGEWSKDKPINYPEAYLTP
jgi:antitoxin component YwqK of YwqJK toxin-antitoxin module